MTINAVLLAVVIMLGLSLARVHVVLSLLIGAIAGGLLAGLGITATLEAFQEGIQNGAGIALSYALLGQDCRSLWQGRSLSVLMRAVPVS